jgi:hypothetical protein
VQGRALLAYISDELRAEVLPVAGEATVQVLPCDSSHKDVKTLPAPGQGPKALIGYFYRIRQAQQRRAGAVGLSILCTIEGCYVRIKRLNDDAKVFFVTTRC